MRQPAGVILAGGQARRMGGGDKGLLPLADGTILSHVIARFAPQVAELALNANGDPTRFSAFGLTVVSDTVADFPGPLAGVLAGLDWAAAEGHSHIVTVAADTPFFPCDLVPVLLHATEGAEQPLALAVTPGGRHPTFGVWPVSLRDNLRTALLKGTRKVVAWTDAQGCADAHFPEDAAFFNVNTPEDLTAAQAMFEAQ